MQLGDDPPLDKLKRSRGSLRRKMTMFIKFIGEQTQLQKTEDIKRTLIVVQLDSIKPILNKFDEVQTSIEDILNIPEDEVRSEFETSYYSAVASAEDLLQRFKVNTKSRSFSISSHVKDLFKRSNITIQSHKTAQSDNVRKSNVQHLPIISVLNDNTDEKSEVHGLSASSSSAKDESDLSSKTKFVRSCTSPKPGNLNFNSMTDNDRFFTPGIKSVSLTPKYDGATTTRQITTQENETKVKSDQFFSIPLVAAFTVYQDKGGLPNKVEPIFEQDSQNAVSVSEVADKERQKILRHKELQREEFCRKLDAEAKQKALEFQLKTLQEQQKQQEYLVRQQRIIQDQQIQHQKLLQEQIRLQQNDRPFVSFVNQSNQGGLGTQDDLVSNTERPVFFTTTGGFHGFQKEIPSLSLNGVSGINISPTAPKFLQELPLTTSTLIFSRNTNQNKFNNLNNLNGNSNSSKNIFNNLNTLGSDGNKFNQFNNANTLVSLQNSLGLFPGDLQAVNQPFFNGNFNQPHSFQNGSQGHQHQLSQNQFQNNFVQNQHRFEQFDMQWHTIPPRATYSEGIWKAAAKSTKRCSRIDLGNDPNDFSCLTLDNYLMGEAPNALPEENVQMQQNRLNRWQLVTFIHFWKLV